MEKQNGKFPSESDSFEDIFSSSKKDGFEDIFSDSGETSAHDDQAYEDIYSGRDEPSSAKYTDPYAGFFDDPPAGANLQTEENRFRTRVNTAPEKKPYSYHYDEPDHSRTRARNGDTIYDDAHQPVRSAPKKRRHVGLKIFCVVLAVILVLVGGAGMYGYSSVKKLLGKTNYVPLRENAYIASSELVQADYLKSILLIGVDAREGQDVQKTRSDTMLLVTIDTRSRQIKLTSFLRDLYVEIPDYRSDKINAAHSRGGTQLLVDTIEYNFHVQIDNYMLVSFDMFTAIVDKLGGVDVEITQKEAKYLNSGDHMTSVEKAAFPEKLEAGMQHFSGAQALWYSRIRYLDSDFMRTGRQRKVITALVKKAAGNSPVTLFQLAEEVMPMVQTDLREDEMLDIGMHALTYLQYDIVQQQIPADGTWKSAKRRSQDVLLPDMDENCAILKNFLLEKAPVEEPESEKNA